MLHWTEKGWQTIDANQSKIYNNQVAIKVELSSSSSSPYQLNVLYMQSDLQVNNRMDSPT